ncbi:MAG: cytochrome b/b6 domain-containing protein, partial [Chitinophagales bacterium]
WFHWINFPILFLMIWSGTLIYWANDIYHIKIGGLDLIHFYPDSWYSLLNIPYHLAEGMAWHFVFMWVFLINGFLYVAYTIISGEWKYLLPDKRSFKEAWLVVLHDLHVRKELPPQGKYNAAQRIAYTAIIIMGFGSIITGFAIYKPTQFWWLTAICGGYETARLIHFILTIGYLLFFIIHIAQVILAGWNNFRGMVAGFDVVNDKVEVKAEEGK